MGKKIIFGALCEPFINKKNNIIPDGCSLFGQFQPPLKSLTFTFISKSIMEYFDFEVSQIGIDHETKSKFVTFTICNNNPFTTAMAADLFENVSTINGVNTSHLKFLSM